MPVFDVTPFPPIIATDVYGKQVARQSAFFTEKWRRQFVQPVKTILRSIQQFRPNSALDDKTPDEFYFESLPAMKKAA
jgi:hypothetical protein